MTNDTPAPPRRRRIWRWFLFIVLALIILLGLATAGGAWWLFSWRIGELRFHESWSEAQRAEIQTLAGRMLRFGKEMQESEYVQKVLAAERELNQHVRKVMADLSDKNREEGSVEFVTTEGPAEPPQWVEWLSMTIAERVIMSKPYRALLHMAATGQADSSATDSSVAQVACRMGYLELAAEFIRRGENPNTPVCIMGVTETPLQSALAGSIYFSEEKSPVEERIKLLDVMLRHGADLNACTEAGDQNAHGIYFLISALTPPYDHGAILEWMLEHGMEIRTLGDEAQVAQILTHDGTLPTFRRLAQKGLLPDTSTMKALLLRDALTAHESAEEKLLWCLDELHTDPNFILMMPQEKEDEEGNPVVSVKPKEHAIYRLLWRIRPELDSHNPEDVAAFDSILRMLDILVEHGATVGDEKPRHIMLPQDEVLRTRLLDALEKYHIPRRRKITA